MSLLFYVIFNCIFSPFESRHPIVVDVKEGIRENTAEIRLGYTVGKYYLRLCDSVNNTVICELCGLKDDAVTKIKQVEMIWTLRVDERVIINICKANVSHSQIFHLNVLNVVENVLKNAGMHASKKNKRAYMESR